MTYPITINVELLKRLIEFYMPTTSEDRDAAMKAIEEIGKYIDDEKRKTLIFRDWIGGTLLIFDSEIDEELQNRLLVAA